MVLMTAGLAFLLAELSSPTPALASRMGLAVLGMATAYGVVCGAMMFAGEREAGTMVFLDIFSGRRGWLWFWKAFVGIPLAVTEALAVAGALYLLRIEPP